MQDPVGRGDTGAHPRTPTATVCLQVAVVSVFAGIGFSLVGSVDFKQFCNCTPVAALAIHFCEDFRCDLG
jgi:hypothetical protein